MPECLTVFAGGNSRSLCLFCPLRPPYLDKGFGQTCAYIPSPPTSTSNWTPAQLSTDSHSLSPDLAHDPPWQLALWAKLQTPPTPLLFSVTCFAPKKLLVPQRRLCAKTDTTTIMASVLMCKQCAEAASLQNVSKHALAQLKLH
ncbi:hypothetical protein PAMP_016441 [Pampus punctatissimus]